jgi:hypothetical protein
VSGGNASAILSSPTEYRNMKYICENEQVLPKWAGVCSTQAKKRESCKQKVKENRILTVTCFRSFVLHRELQRKFEVKLCDTWA